MIVYILCIYKGQYIIHIYILDDILYKCFVNGSSVSFFDFIVSAGSIRMDPAKVREVADWLPPALLS